MKRALVLFLSLIMMVTVLTACGKAGVGGGGTDLNRPIVLRFAAPEGQFADEIEQFKNGFKEVYPNVTIKYEPISGDWSSKLLGQLASGSAPDIFWTDSVYKFASKNALEELDPWFEKKGVDKSDYYESMFVGGQYDGKQYMIPREYNHVVTFYNKKIFRETFANTAEEDLPFTNIPGTKYPANGWTWDEFVATASAIKFTNSSGNFLRRGADISFAWDSSGPTIFEGLGGTIVDENENVIFSNANNLEILTELRNLVNDGTFVNSVKNDVGDIFSGKVGMMFNSRPATSTFEEKFGSDWDVVNFPILPEKQIVASGSSGYVVNKASKNKDMAIEFLFYLISDEGQEVFMETGNCVPVKKDLIDSDTWRSNPRTDINHDAFIYEPSYDVLPFRLTLSSDAAKGDFDNAWKNFVTAFLNGDYTVQQAMEFGQTEFEKYI